MKNTRIEWQRAMVPSLQAAAANVGEPAPVETGRKVMSIAELKACPVPPLHDNPYLDCAGADPKILDWLYSGAKPQSAPEIDCLASFCVRQKLPDALSWLVLQCELDKLCLSHGYLGTEGVQIVASWLQHCPRPIALDFSRQEIGDEGAVTLANALRNNTRVISLDLTYNFIGDEGALALADMLKTNLTLASLTLACNCIRDTGAVALANVLRTNATLTSLNVPGSHYGRFGDIAAIAFADMLKFNKTLISLNAVYNKIGATGAVAFADGLKLNSTLTSLSVAGNHISDAGAAAFADVLTTNSTLTSLDLANNQIAVSGAETFAVKLKTNSTLTDLRVASNYVDNDGVTSSAWLYGAVCTSAFAEHQVEIDRRLDINAKAKPLVLPADEAFMTLSASWESPPPLEVVDLIIRHMVTLGPDEGDRLKGLESLVIANDIVRQRRRDESS